MANYLPQINELILRHEKTTSFCKFFLTDVDTSSLRNFGYLFGLVEYEKNLQNLEELFDAVFKALADNYYKEKSDNLNSEERLEIGRASCRERV